MRRLARMLPNAATFVTMLAAVIAVAGCCPREVTKPQVVNTAPLDAAHIAADTTTILPLFPDRAETVVAAGRHEDGTPNADGIVDWIRSRPLMDALVVPGVNVNVYLYRSEAAATKSFEFEWRHMWWKPDLSKFTRRGRPGDQCVISYLRRTRVGADVPFSCSYTEAYDSFVISQKGKVIVVVEETSSDTGGRRKERAIAEVARILDRAAGTPPTAGEPSPHPSR